MAIASDDGVKLANFAVSFIDLLGQKEAMRGQGLLPEHATPDQRDALIRLVKQSVGKISGLHRNAQKMLGAILEPRDPPAPLNPAQLELWRELHASDLSTQRWSDGLMMFTRLGGTTPIEQINGLFAQFCLAGTMCLTGMAASAPMRGGIDVAWGVELYPGELYGPALANAYLLESNTAQFPRIVMSERVRQYLLDVLAVPGDDLHTKTSRQFASRCLDMIAADGTGILYLDYLSPCFEESVTSSQIEMLWGRAREFIEAEIDRHGARANAKLVDRYGALATYFDAHPPPSRRKA